MVFEWTRKWQSRKRNDSNDLTESAMFLSVQLLHSISHEVRLDAPYIPSFLSMRESEHFVQLIQDLRGKPSDKVPFPQVFLVDGNGQLHERQAGLATVLGVLADVPTIGCAKDYHPMVYSEGCHPPWLSSQKGFKAICRDALQSRGTWLGIPSPATSTTEYIGAVRS